MINFYPYILGLTDKLNEWNEKLNAFASEHLSSVGAGTAVLAVTGDRDNFPAVPRKDRPFCLI